MSAPDIPQEYWLHPEFSGSLDLDLDNIHIKELPRLEIDTSIKEIPKIVTDSTISMGLDDIRVKELPTLHLELNVNPTRVHLPSHYKICASLFGIEFFSWSFCGESMMINEPYLAHRTEKCE
ncbi:MAG: hypothetical protein ACREIF_14300 [Chthoniobacterales bacterium]